MIMVFDIALYIFHVIVFQELCNYEEWLIVGRRCINCDQRVSCAAWFLRKPEDFVPFPNLFHIKNTHYSDSNGELFHGAVW